MSEMKKSPLACVRSQLQPVLWHAGSLGFFINLLILPVSLYSLQVLDRVMGTGSLATLIWLTVIMIVLFIAASVLQSLRGMALLRAGDWMAEELNGAALPLVLSQAAQHGTRGAQPLRDVTAIRQFLSGAGLTTLVDAPWSVLYIAVLFVIHPALGVLVTAGAAILLGLAYLNERITADPLHQANAYTLRGMQELELATRNAEVAEAMGMTKNLADRWKCGQQDAVMQTAQAGDRSSVVQGVTKFTRLTLQILVTAISAWLALQGSITVGAIIAATILASRALAPFEAAISGWKSMLEARTAHERLKELFAREVRREGMSLPAPSGWLSAEGVFYTPPGQQQPILRNVSFRLEAGEALGIIGPSGSGKSTLARLITGTQKPVAGVVRLDGADVYTWPREEFGRYLGYLPQDVELFGGSIRDNIARMRDDAEPEAIVQAAQLANAHEMILRLPQGYDTDIGPGGAALSGGQKQRIGLARAMYGLPCLLVLDEPDANLDESGQQALLLALQHTKARRITTIVITHRKSILNHVDKLMVLRDGTVDSFGSPQDVVSALNARTRGERTVA
jgi:PrtD family type I secretion system ABC transporter